MRSKVVISETKAGERDKTRIMITKCDGYAMDDFCKLENMQFRSWEPLSWIIHVSIMRGWKGNNYATKLARQAQWTMVCC